MVIWKERYILLNRRNIWADGELNEQLLGEVTRQEVEGVLKNKNGKLTGLHGIQVGVWEILEGEWVYMLHQLIRKIMEKELIPEKWKVFWYLSLKIRETSRSVKTIEE